MIRTPLRATGSLSLICLLILSGCGGAGGGSSGAPPAAALPSASTTSGVAISESAMTAARVETTNAVLPAALPAITFPLYPFHMLGSSDGTRSEDTTGDITINFRTTEGPRTLTFRAGETVTSDGEGFLRQKTPTTLLAEAWADGSEGWQFDYTRIGTLVYEDRGTPVISLFAYGYETPLANIPTSRAVGIGTAQYDGRTTGIVYTTEAATIAGDVRLMVNFQSDAVTGVLTNLLKETETGTEPLGVSFVVSSGQLLSRTDPALAIVQGTLTGVSDTTNLARTGTGSLGGRLFGPRAQELAGGWSFDDAGYSILGLFYAARDPSLDLDPPSVMSTDDGALVATAGQLTFPMRAAGSEVEASRRRTLAGDVALRAALGSTNATAVPLSLVASASNGNQFTGTATGRWDEFAAFDTPASELGYARYAHLVYAEGTASLDRYYYFGYETPAAALPTAGSAVYYGRAIGSLTTGTVVESLSGLVDLNLDFPGARVRGKFSALEITDGTGARRPFLDGTLQVDGDVAVSTDPGSGPQGVQITGQLFNGVSAGSVRGRAYGPALEELAGSWNWSGTLGATAASATGAFGARTGLDEHPSGAPRLAPWLSSVDTEFPLSQAVIRTTSANAGAVPAVTEMAVLSGTIRPQTGGGIRMETEHGDDDFRTTLDGETFGHALPGVFATGAGTPQWMRYQAHADENDEAVVLGSVDSLSYARFGYWEDRTGGPLLQYRGVFYTGRETPAAEIPGQGTATYLGTSVGFGTSPTGFARLNGGLTMTADFGTRAVTGRIDFAGGAEYLAATQNSASFAFDHLRLNGTIAAGTNAFAGSVDARSITDVNTTMGTGAFDGKFFGREAQELAGKWNVSSPDGSVKAWGAFGGTR